MSVVENKIGREKVRFGCIDNTTSFSKVKNQVFEMKLWLKNSESLAIEVRAEKGSWLGREPNKDSRLPGLLESLSETI